MQIGPINTVSPFVVTGATGTRPGGSSPKPTGVTGSKGAPTGESDTVEISAEAESTLANELTPEQKKQVQKLKARDREVRAHEQAHVAAAGPYARGGPTYEYQKGPDGQRYAIGGEVQIDTAPVEGDPEATIEKARVVRAAALAPAEPSAQDRRVAAAATKMEADARRELQKQQQEEKEAEEEPNTFQSVGQFIDLVA